MGRCRRRNRAKRQIKQEITSPKVEPSTTSDNQHYGNQTPNDNTKVKVEVSAAADSKQSNQNYAIKKSWLWTLAGIGPLSTPLVGQTSYIECSVPHVWCSTTYKSLSDITKKLTDSLLAYRGAEGVDDAFPLCRTDLPYFVRPLIVEMQSIVHPLQWPTPLQLKLCFFLNQVITWICLDYLPRKEYACKRELFHLMGPRVKAYGKRWYELRKEAGGLFAPILSIVLIATAINYLLIQEMAINDPSVEKMEDSTFITHMRKIIRWESTVCEIYYNRLWKNRKSYISKADISLSEKLVQKPKHQGGGSATEYLVMVKWKDKFNGELVSTYKTYNTREAAKKAMKDLSEDVSTDIDYMRYMTGKELELLDALGMPFNTVRTWMEF